MHGPLARLPDEPTDCWLARNLLEMLRHCASSSGLNPDAGGWVRVPDLLRHRALRGLDMALLYRLSSNRVQWYMHKFQVQEAGGTLTAIRAVQGHTMSHIRPEAIGNVIHPGETQALTLFHCTPTNV